MNKKLSDLISYLYDSNLYNSIHSINLTPEQQQLFYENLKQQLTNESSQQFIDKLKSKQLI